MGKPEINDRQIRMVHYLARRLGVGTDRRAQDELVATGMLGLAEAQASYREDGGASFRTLAAIHIRGRILDELRRNQRWHLQVKAARDEGAVLARRDLAAGPESSGALELVPAQEAELAPFEDADKVPAPSEATLAVRPPAAPTQRTLESLLTRRELVARMRQALGQLKAKEQEALRLHYLEGLETDEIARRWGCTRRTVNSLCKHGRERLRRLMQIRPEEARLLGL